MASWLVMALPRSEKCLLLPFPLMILSVSAVKTLWAIWFVAEEDGKIWIRVVFC